MTDSGNGQGETDEADNFRVSQTTITLQVPDLTVASATAPASASVQQTITVSWTVTNIGAYGVYKGTERWTDHVFVSPDPTFLFERAQRVGSVVHLSPSLGSATPASSSGPSTPRAAPPAPRTSTERPDSASPSRGLDGSDRLSGSRWVELVKEMDDARIAHGDRLGKHPAVDGHVANAGLLEIRANELLRLPVDLFIEDPDLDYYRAKKAADARAHQVSEEPMLLAWYDRRSGQFSPRVE